MEVYVDDMLVRSKNLTNHVVELRETLDILRKYKMRLNLKKCAFGVRSTKSLGFIVTNEALRQILTRSKLYLTCNHLKLLRKYIA